MSDRRAAAPAFPSVEGFLGVEPEWMEVDSFTARWAVVGVCECKVPPETDVLMEGGLLA